MKYHLLFGYSFVITDNIKIVFAKADNGINNRMVLLHVKNECVHVILHSGFRETTLLHVMFPHTLWFCSCYNMSGDKQGSDTKKCHDESLFHALVNKMNAYCMIIICSWDRWVQLSVFSSSFGFISSWHVHIMALYELIGYTWKSICVTSQGQCSNIHLFWWCHTC